MSHLCLMQSFGGRALQAKDTNGEFYIFLNSLFKAEGEEVKIYQK